MVARVGANGRSFMPGQMPKSKQAADERATISTTVTVTDANTGKPVTLTFQNGLLQSAVAKG